MSRRCMYATLELCPSLTRFTTLHSHRSLHDQWWRSRIYQQASIFRWILLQLLDLLRNSSRSTPHFMLKIVTTERNSVLGLPRAGVIKNSLNLISSDHTTSPIRNQGVPRRVLTPKSQGRSRCSRPGLRSDPLGSPSLNQCRIRGTKFEHRHNHTALG